MAPKLQVIDENLTKSLHQTHSSLIDSNQGKKEELSSVFLGHQNYCINYNVLTAIARILSLKEVCGCTYLKKGKILVSTNSSEADLKKDTRGKRSRIQPNKIEKSSRLLREEIGEIIYDLLKSEFSKNQKTRLCQKLFSTKILYLLESSTLSTLCYKKEEENSIKIVQIMQDFKKFSTWDDSCFSKFANIRKKVKKILDENEKEIDFYLRKEIALILTYLADLEEIMDLEEKKQNQKIKFESNFHSNIRSAIISSGKSWSNRYDSVKNLHAELANIQRENLYIPMETVTKEVIAAANEGKMAISKIMCLVCNTFFESLVDVYKKRNSCELNVKILGSSLTFFPGFKSFFLEEEDFNWDLKKIIESKISEIQKKMVAVEKKNQGMIETSPYNKYAFSKYAINEISSENYTIFSNDSF